MEEYDEHDGVWDYTSVNKKEIKRTFSDSLDDDE